MMINSISTSSETDKSKCISCMRCVSICPVHSY
ncbi:MAG: 4Fe-4S binding protein [Clostridiales bacterium]|nr:4Fe-4S binding protein [Clostridiales bacterium]